KERRRAKHALSRQVSETRTQPGRDSHSVGRHAMPKTSMHTELQIAPRNQDRANLRQKRSERDLELSGEHLSMPCRQRKTKCGKTREGHQSLRCRESSWLRQF